MVLLNKIEKFVFAHKAWILAVILFIGGLVSSDSYANLRVADNYFRQGKYVAAVPAYFNALSSAGRNPLLRGRAEWGLAQSLHKMDLLYSASKYYSILVKRGPRAQNPYFRKAFEKLGVVNRKVSLGYSHIVQLFDKKIKLSYIPGQARGFYFHYKGIEAYRRKNYKNAKKFFSKVKASSDYYVQSLFHLGVIANLNKNHTRAISRFEQVRSRAPDTASGDWVRELANLNIARVYYEKKNYREAIRFYAEIPRESDNWLEAIFEASWAFFLMQNHNSTLGNIHTIQSPFFENRFFPETYILQAITYLRLCRFDGVKVSLKGFTTRYKSVKNDIQKVLRRYKGENKEFFKLIHSYRTGRLNKYKHAWSLLDSLSRTDAYREAGRTIRYSDAELAKLSRAPSSWRSSGLLDELRSFLKKKKVAASKGAGKRLFGQGKWTYSYLLDLISQKEMIKTEMLLGKIDKLRSMLRSSKKKDEIQFIGGMIPLNVAQDLEYWPFEGEYWEDELGGYVYNLESKCVKGK